MYSFAEASIKVSPLLPIKGIFYIGQYGTSGYATAAKGYLYRWFTWGIPITWEPLYFDNSAMSDDDIYNVIVKSLINKRIPEYDMAVLHSTPDLWPGFWKDKSKILTNKLVKGYCTWETNRLPKHWIESMNNCVGEIWCPSTYNKISFEESGVTRPIQVMPHEFLGQPLPDPKLVKMTNSLTKENITKDNDFIFYSIGELNPRKGIDDIINCYCKSFTDKDPVKLILKVHYKDYSPTNKEKCKLAISDILNLYPFHPPVICIMDNMTDKELLGLHSIGDCYISLSKSEGFGLTIFDAYNYKRAIIATGYGGHIDFLGKNYAGLVNYKTGPVTGMKDFSANYGENQIWAYPDLDHAVELMKKVVSK